MKFVKLQKPSEIKKLIFFLISGLKLVTRIASKPDSGRHNMSSGASAEDLIGKK